MSARLASGLMVKALLRRVDQAGGSGVVLARGDDMGGGILVLALERGENPRFFERGLGPSGAVALIETGPQNPEDEAEITAYWQRRRHRDPDLWVIELDIAQAERFAAEMLIF